MREYKKAVITNRKQAECIIDKLPDLKPGWCLIRITVAPMCTEYKNWLNGDKISNIGHEAVGVVEETSKGCSHRVGDRVVVMPQTPCLNCELCKKGQYIHCQNTISYQSLYGTMNGQATYANYMIKQDAQLYNIPDDISDEMASLALCALGPSLNAMHISNVTAHDKVLITGLGPVGMGAIVNAKYRNAKVFVIDKDEERMNMAKEYFSIETDNYFDSIEKSIDVAIDCSGSEKAHRLCIDSLKPLGKMIMIGESSEDTVIHASKDMIRKGISIIGAWHYPAYLFESMMDVIRNSPYAKKLITHQFDLDDIQEAFTQAAKTNRIKILLKP